MEPRWHVRCFKNHCFYNEKGVEARIEAGLDEPRWHVRCYKNHCFYNEKVVEARIEAGLDELRWSLDDQRSANKWLDLTGG